MLCTFLQGKLRLGPVPVLKYEGRVGVNTRFTSEVFVTFESNFLLYVSSSSHGYIVFLASLVESEMILAFYWFHILRDFLSLLQNWVHHACAKSDEECGITIVRYIEYRQNIYRSIAGGVARRTLTSTVSKSHSSKCKRKEKRRQWVH